MKTLRHEHTKKSERSLICVHIYIYIITIHMYVYIYKYITVELLFSSLFWGIPIYIFISIHHPVH